MMGLRVIIMAGFLAGIEITGKDLGIGEVLEAHSFEVVVETLKVMTVYLEVEAGRLELITAGRDFQKAVGMIG